MEKVVIEEQADVGSCFAEEVHCVLVPEGAGPRLNGLGRGLNDRKGSGRPDKGIQKKQRNA